MKNRKREILVLVLVVSICAVLFADKLFQPGVTFNPDQLIIETRYSQRKADTIWLKRGEDRLVELPRSFVWNSGGKLREVLPLLGKPKYTAEFVGDTLYIWECSVRYDWDYQLEHPGRYLALGSIHGGVISSASSYPELPINAVPITDEQLKQLEAEDRQEDW
ncbi:MAG: hypothetical protein WC314_05250 [Vulcanimicrobiota bacterium]